MQTRWVREAWKTITPTRAAEFGEQQENVWEHASLERDNALLALYPVPVSSLYAKTSTCGEPDLTWQKENPRHITMITIEKLKTRAQT